LDFVALRSAVAGRAAFYDVADIDVLALDADRLEHSVQELACPPHKRESLLVLIGAGPFAHENKLRLRAALTKDNRLAACRQAAAMAVAQVRANLLQGLALTPRRRRGLEQVEGLRRKGRGSGFETGESGIGSRGSGTGTRLGNEF